ncbi:carboxyl-terminal processing protease [Pseudochelatococcus lubricantis]|uniref:Carboxyl-terminal processing protease n=1 Tax=Pseudochelatococcus lubricantis TaxID=1538102 RepID=A0ABX0V219_9HYPH|nr:S41 family peptidase [Pseudochelatococcus lubricantis]NIJ58604.1 carboxyl-terminal processing protease [Pseudochelatococcus lubricantis]
MRKISLVMVGALIGAGVAVVGTQSRLFSSTSAIAASVDTYRQLTLFGDVFDKVRSDYVEKPDESKLIESAVTGMLSSLDPHSSYMDAKSYRDMQVQTRGSFGGLGIEVTMEDGLVKVVSPIDETPAARAGILANDLIVAIDNEPVQGLTINQAVEKMRGAVDSEVTLKIQRTGRSEPFEVKLKRDIIRIRSVRFENKGDIGYLRITQFNEQTFDNLSSAVEKLTKEIPADKLKGFVIDLRNNPGGLLDQAVLVSDAFLERGEIVSTRGRNLDETQRFNARSGDITKGKPLVVLVNGGSASASEIVAGALQDHQRAKLIGTRSFGKGSVQTIIPLGQNGALRLTTARYYTPSGRSIQAKGIEPDFIIEEVIPDDLKGKDQIKGEAGLRGHLKNGEDASADKSAATEVEATDSKKEEASGSSAYVPTDPTQDTQLNAAYDLLRGVENPALVVRKVNADAGTKTESAANVTGKKDAAKPADKPAVDGGDTKKDGE